MSLIPKIDICIYHRNCQDGLASAYIVKRFNGNHHLKLFETNPGPQIDRKLPDVRNKTVAIVDISFDRETMVELYNDAKFLVCLDHHKSSKIELDGLNYCIFDMERAGCQLTWDYLFPGEPRPDYIEYIAGRDMWDYDKRNTSEFTVGLSRTLSSVKKDKDKFKYFDKFHNSNKKKVAALYKFYVDYGSEELKDIRADVANITKRAIKCKIRAYTAYVVDTKIYRSDVCNKLLVDHKCEVAAAYNYDLLSDLWLISLRSLKGSGIDVSELAKDINDGGGHENASCVKYTGNLRDLFEINFLKKV